MAPEYNVAGESLTVLDDSENWWKLQNSKGQEGFVPSNYLKLIGTG